MKKICQLLALSLILISSYAFAEGPITSYPGGGDGGGVGIGIDIGSVFNVIKNLKKDIPGNITAQAKDSTNCGKGKLCFNVTVPKNKTGIGQAALQLLISQGGKAMTTLNSPVITKDGLYCFEIDPATMQGLNLSKGFDYSVNANYTLSAVKTEQWLGQNGQIAGADNDYQAKCEAIKPPVVTTNYPNNKHDDNDEIERGAREIYPSIKSPKVSIEQFIAQQKAAYQEYQSRKNQREKRSSISAKNSAQSISTCKANGDFEKPTITNWTGAYNDTVISSRSPTSLIVPTPITPPWNSGIINGVFNALVTNDAARQTLVGPGPDPIVGPALQMVRAGGGSQSVRIGTANVWPFYSSELLEKTFVVTPADTTVGFWYAVVLNDGGHGGGNPAFTVRVLNASGSDISLGRVNLGANSNQLIADTNNLFFTSIQRPQYVFHNSPVVYKDWSCASIDLSGLVGQVVTIQYITKDCDQGAHWAYAYIDDFCSTCGKGKEGWVEAVKTNPTCGNGKLCFDATMPKANGTSGQAKLTLSIIQNGVTLTTMVSPTLTADGQYCFNITPSSIPGIDMTKGFDYAVKADYAFGSTNIGSQWVGNLVDGQQTGKDNDYQPKCDVNPPSGSCNNPLTPGCPPISKEAIHTSTGASGSYNIDWVVHYANTTGVTQPSVTVNDGPISTIINGSLQQPTGWAGSLNGASTIATWNGTNVPPHGVMTAPFIPR